MVLPKGKNKPNYRNSRINMLGISNGGWLASEVSCNRGVTVSNVLIQEINV